MALSIRWTAALTAAAQWRRTPLKRRRLIKLHKLRFNETKQAPSHNPAQERRALARRLVNLDTNRGREANMRELGRKPDWVDGAHRIATLMQIAHGQEEGVTEMMQFRACDALATISHWLRKIATNGQSMDAAKHGDDKPIGMFVPSLKVIGYEQYQ